MHELLESPEKLKNYLIQRLDALLADTVNEISISDRIRIEGNCNEIELMLLELFDVNTEQIELLKEKVRRSEEYYRLKYDGYCLTANSDGKHVTLKNGRIVEAKFWLVDNGVGDMQAVITAYDFQKWLKMTGVTKLKWMLEAEIIPPSLIEVEQYSFEGFELMACRVSQWAISCQQRPGTGLCDRECECIIKGKLWIIGAECLCRNKLIIGDIREV